MFEYVLARVMATSSPSRSINSITTSLGLGVVEQISFVLWPSRMPNWIMSQDSRRYSQAANSSSQPPWNCGPRNRSGSDAGMPLMNEPLIRWISCRLLLYFSINTEGITLINPESPSKHVPFKSPLVGAETSHRVPGCSHAHIASVSAAARVFPAPLPASISQMFHHSPAGSIWCLCACT